jgi:hypothetical protein
VYFSALSTRGWSSNGIDLAKRVQLQWFFILPRKEPGIPGEVADSRAGAENSSMSLEHLVVSESKELLRRKL